MSDREQIGSDSCLTCEGTGTYIDDDGWPVDCPDCSQEETNYKVICPECGDFNGYVAASKTEAMKGKEAHEALHSGVRIEETNETARLPSQKEP